MFFDISRLMSHHFLLFVNLSLALLNVQLIRVFLLAKSVVACFSTFELSHFILWLVIWQKPAAIRVDQLDRRSLAGDPSDGVLIYPLIVHMTYTPMKLSLTREPKYKSVLKNFMKLQYLMMNKPKISPTDRAQLAQLANELEDMEHCGWVQFSSVTWSHDSVKLIPGLRIRFQLPCCW